MAELLSIPLKKSVDVDIVKPLKNLIEATYSSGGNNEDHTDALNELSRLRTNAIWKVSDKANLEALYDYYDQLLSLESKIPPQEVQIPFKWKDAFDRGSIFGHRMSLTVSSLAFERVCILFNMAAMQSSVAASQPLDTEESLKLAAKLLQQSSGIMSHLKGAVPAAVHRDVTPDLCPDSLHALSLLTVAQAQEVILYKSIRDEMKPSMVAKLSAACEEMYAEAARALQKESVKQMWEREWLTVTLAKRQIWEGIAQFYQSAVCNDSGLHGEEIARLKVAHAAVTAGMGVMPANPRMFVEIAAKIQRRLNEANRDNDFIYHDRIPEPSQLSAVPRAAVAKSLPIQEKYSSSTNDLFKSLVPMAVHQALNAVEARKAEMVHVEINKLRDATQMLNSILASLNLPACIESASQSGGLPDSIKSKAAAIRDLGGVDALDRLMTDLPDLLQRNKEILDEAERMLREEREADQQLRSQFGAKWTRTESDKLTDSFRANADKYRQIIDSAVRADSIVKEKYQQHKRNIELLSRSDSEIESNLPASTGSRGGDQNALATLRQLMDQVETVKAVRETIESELKSVNVDLRKKFSKAMATQGSIDEPAISASELGAVIGPLQKQVATTISEQEELVERIRGAHAAWSGARGGAGGGRDAALGGLAAAHDAYQELTNNLNEGVKFYNDLTQLLLAFQNKVSDFCFARRTEKEELLKDLTQDASRHTSAPEPAARKVEVPRPAPPPPQPAHTSQVPQNPQQYLPYPTQPQGMPLPYAPMQQAQAPYPMYAPMPPTYNPYATLPFPSQQYPYYPHPQYPPPRQ